MEQKYCTNKQLGLDGCAYPDPCLYGGSVCLTCKNVPINRHSISSITSKLRVIEAALNACEFENQWRSENLELERHILNGALHALTKIIRE